MSKYAIAVDPANPQQFIQIPVPEAAPGEFDLLVEVKAIAMNPVDTKVHAGLKKNGLQQPRILGWDATGVVVAVVPKATGFAIGDEVWYAGDITRSGSNTTHQLIDSRIVGHKPKSLNWVESAAIPLTALTAWEGLFEHLKIQDAGSDKTLLIIGGAGGVGSLAIPLAALRSKVRIIATASRPESAKWCLERGADLTVDYRNLQENLLKHDIKQVDYIFCLNDTDGHWKSMSDVIAPFGHICSIVESAQPLEQSLIRSKGVALHWELMFTRSMYQTPDMAEQGRILQQVANMIDKGELKGTLNTTLHGLSVETITQAHAKQLEGHMTGKIAIEF
ncbi:zinc-binding alcohol dehydrogenase family protein [Budviciaceae bacterium BWR-B9]|uniref:Zinc-type alcohol dehydrogenase-like protein n=1 Tax=Limnobaculum allomyrinae TaxID=2791986 RepID=A0ABS1INA1_9GAMM|nr:MULTISPECIES: zinc-binding alcohol dehydrogenase family protein [Limnobaculum]MBK5143216.1 zinc-binding alcohol dehydrogenase family protein [Limnobaculum allomyrinae]MBV7691104.1 zinc-binding alcohol dehydrogenase family protein [Limnobaculum sp. M2-1]